MKTHLLIGTRTACDSTLPRHTLFTIDARMVSCQLCRKTKLFRSVIRQQTQIRSASGEKRTQPELFSLDT